MDSSITVTARPRSVVAFFLLAFGISWAVWIPAALGSHGLIPAQFSFAPSPLLGTFGPFIAALIATAIFDGRAGFGSLFKRFLVWRVNILWYLFVLLWPAIFSLIKTGVAVLIGAAVPDFSQPPFVSLYPIPAEVKDVVPFIAFLPFVFLQQMLLGSSMGEEPGWRGYALPRLQDGRSSLVASLVLGFLWGIWHLPNWLMKGNPVQQNFLGWEILGLMATTVLFTWVFNNTKGSLLLALLFHTSIAITGLFLASAEIPSWLGVALNWAAVAVVVTLFGAKRLSRKG
jgi:membrane protease YdiL (CAAX protease family)